MEFVKPKPGLVENLFLISGRHHWFLSPVCWGWGRPWSCSQLSTLAAHPGPPGPHCGVRVGFLASTRCLETQISSCSVIWGPPSLKLREPSLWLIHAEPAVCILSLLRVPRDPEAWLSLVGPPLSFLWPKTPVES